MKTQPSYEKRTSSRRLEPATLGGEDLGLKSTVHKNVYPMAWYTHVGNDSIRSSKMRAIGVSIRRIRKSRLTRGYSSNNMVYDINNTD